MKTRSYVPFLIVGLVLFFLGYLCGRTSAPLPVAKSAAPLIATDESRELRTFPTRRHAVVSDDAKRMILTAANDGSVIEVPGQAITAGGVVIGGSSPREYANAKASLEELIAAGFVEYSPTRLANKVKWVLTKAGFEFVDSIKGGDVSPVTVPEDMTFGQFIKMSKERQADFVIKRLAEFRPKGRDIYRNHVESHVAARVRVMTQEMPDSSERSMRSEIKDCSDKFVE